jgi:hypothetical protein
MNEKKLEWVAYCFECNRELDRTPNGVWVEAAARIHRRGNPGHRVMVGYEVEEVAA